jgi:S-(hydroxymethyl)glutathione dehydrogenase/alcohol dehydrogenase
MRAAVLWKQREPLTIEDVDLQEPQYGEVRVKLTASGVCHSCLHAADGSWTNTKIPIVLGDEGAGVVEAIGPGVTTVNPGDHVVLSWAPSCGQCHYCVIGRPVLCERRSPIIGQMLDGTTRMKVRGETVYHYGYVSTFATHSVMPESCAIPIDEDIPLELAALIGCSVTTGVGSVLNTAKVEEGASLAVFGTGGIGLNVVQGGVLANAYPIIAVDVMPNKLAYAETMGATHLVDSSKEDPVAAIRRITRRGADYTIVAVGHAGAMVQAFDSLAPGGTCVIIGLPASGSTVNLDCVKIPGSERCLRGSAYGSARTREDFPRYARLYKSGKLKLDQLVTNRYPLEDINEAFRALAAGEVARGILVF